MIRPASGIIPLRESADGLEVLMVHRGARGSFFPGYWAFPGGGQEQSDAKALPEDPQRACALREMFEETGLWPGASGPTADERAALLAGSLAWPQLLARYTPPELLRAGLRVTPDYAGIRFSAQFYMALVPPELTATAQGSELEGVRWWAVNTARDAWRRGEIFLALPTQHTIQALCEGPSWQEAAARLEAAASHTDPPIAVLPGLAYVPIETPTLPPARHTLAFLLGEERLVVVDPGSAEIERWLGGRPVEAVLFTHHHRDHVGGQHWAAQHGFPIWCHPQTAARLEVPTQRELLDGDDVVGWTVLHTPGHAPGHLALWQADRRILIAGDLVSGLSTILVLPDEGSMADYLASLERCRALDPALVLPSHGGPYGPGSDLLGRTYRHRLEREARVLAALRTSERSFDELFADAYSDCPPPAVPAGRLSLESHLIKLEDEGRAVRAGSAWRIA